MHTATAAVQIHIKCNYTHLISTYFHSPLQVIICSTEEISSASDDFGELHHALTHLPMKHDVERLIQCAFDIYQSVGPDLLLQRAEERRREAAAASSAKANGGPGAMASKAILGNHQRLLFVGGALAVAAAGFVWRRFF